MNYLIIGNDFIDKEATLTRVAREVVEIAIKCPENCLAHINTYYI